LAPDWLKVAILLDTLNQVVLASLLLDDRTGLVRKHTDLLVTFLSVSSGFDHCHDDVFGGHEGEFLADTTTNDGGVDNHSLTDVLKGCEKNIGSEESLG
jgi:hypothetical protein